MILTCCCMISRKRNSICIINFTSKRNILWNGYLSSNILVAFIINSFINILCFRIINKALIFDVSWAMIAIYAGDSSRYQAKGKNSNSCSSFIMSARRSRYCSTIFLLARTSYTFCIRYSFTKFYLISITFRSFIFMNSAVRFFTTYVFTSLISRSKRKRLI